jgi:hypothetical protein
VLGYFIAFAFHGLTLACLGHWAASSCGREMQPNSPASTAGAAELVAFGRWWLAASLSNYCTCLLERKKPPREHHSALLCTPLFLCRKNSVFGRRLLFTFSHPPPSSPKARRGPVDTKIFGANKQVLGDSFGHC